MKEVKKQEEQKKTRRRVKKVKGHGGHHGGAWKVAYADFVTAMMALFLVLWLVSQADTKLKHAIANYFRSPGVFDTTQGGILSSAKKVSKEPTNLTSKDEEQALFSVAEVLRKKFEDRPDFTKYKERIKIEVTDEGLKIDLLDQAEKYSFPVGSSELSEDAKAILREVAKAVCEMPNPIVIGGHTDSRGFPSEKGYTNWELSADRANAARRVLQEECVTKEQIRRIVGYADSQPLVPEDPFAPANRRISIVVLRTTADNPPVAETDKQISPSANPPTNAITKSETAPPKKLEQNKDNSADNSETAKADKSAAADSAQIKEAEKKLATDGIVRVGQPDAIPAVKKQ